MSSRLVGSSRGGMLQDSPGGPHQRGSPRGGTQLLGVRIALDEEADMLDLEVEDDGRGIRETDKAGVGMSSMRERAEELGGNCAVVSSARGGTLVSSLLPYRTADGTDRKEG